MQELEQTVAERTAALTQALERAQEADRLKTQFVADVSHELRTPLTNIRLYLELLRYGNPERFPEYLETLERETGRLVDLIEDLLAISRLDAGTVSPNRVPLNLNDLANGLVKDRSRLFAEKQLEVRFEPYRHLPHVSADERMLSQVIANILTNALHYTHPGGSIVVRTQLRQEADGEWVTLSVSDTGIGIPPSEQPHVFERFFRGAASRDLGVPGTGLGLAICREIMRRHEGRITMESEFRKGSTFTLWLRPLGSDHPMPLAEGEAA
jgi:signal transduction histidine kinase